MNRNITQQFKAQTSTTSRAKLMVKHAKIFMKATWEELAEAEATDVVLGLLVAQDIVPSKLVSAPPPSCPCNR